MKSKMIKEIVIMVSGVAVLIGVWMYNINKAEQELKRVEDAKIEQMKRKKDEEEERRLAIARAKEIYGAMKCPVSGMNGEYVGYTQLGEPHEILKASKPEYFNLNEQYDAMWYFEDEIYDYKCTARVFSLDDGYKIVKEFSVYADSKGTYKFGKLYLDKRSYARRDGKITLVGTDFRNDFKNK